MTNEIQIKVTKTTNSATIPKKGSELSNGMDVYVPSDFKNYTLKPGEWVGIPLGLKFAPPVGYMLMACSRSGLATKNGIVSHIQPGIIDTDYRGEVVAVVRNVSTVDYEITAGLRLMQLVVVSSPKFSIEYVHESMLDETERGSGGFGSTGV